MVALRGMRRLAEETRNIATVATGIIATLSALVLGLMVASAKNSFDTRADEIRESGARLIMLDRALRQYGPDAQKTRDLLRPLIESRIKRVWSPAPSQEGTAGSQTAEIEAIRTQLFALRPANDAASMRHSPQCKRHYTERDQNCAHYPCKAIALAQELAAEERCKEHRYLTGRRNVR